MYAAFDGKCAVCGEPLPDDWHADHIVPWAVSHRTNVHEMQPLCPKCNLEKGKKMYRRHQLEMRTIASRIQRQDDITDILVHVTPGGGKSALPMILAAELAERLNYLICWVVPRDNLRAQGETSFVQPQMRHLFGHRSKLRAVGNEWRPARDTAGYITTYQAITANPQIHRDEFERAAHAGKPYILFLDECHHVPFRGAEGEEAAYFEAIEPLVNLARLRVYASGTFERHDRYHIAFLPYTRIIGSDVVDFGPRQHWLSIQYSRGDALREEAIVPLHMQAMDGAATWLDAATGEVRQVNSMANAAQRNESAILKTVLQTEYAYELLNRCTRSWLDHREIVYSRGKMLVIAPTIAIANEYCAHQVRQGHQTGIATSEDTPAARTAIKNFRGGRGVVPGHEINCLVTVGMAYEGLDVPEITHIACLTNIRSRPWIEQAICRANRTDALHGKTHGFIFYPDDPRMRRIMDAIEAEQQAVVPLLQPRPEPQQFGAGGGTLGPRPGIQPVDSAVTGVRGQGLEDGTHIDYAEFAAIEAAMAQVRIRGVSAVQMAQWRAAMAQTRDESVAETVLEPLVLPPSEETKLLRTTIVRLVGNISHGDTERIVELNREMKMNFGPRDQATIETLRLMIRWLNDTYGDELDGDIL